MRASGSAVSLQFAQKPEETGVAVGYTASKKAIGNSVQRNRARRRLRAGFDRLVRLNPEVKIAGGIWLNWVAKAPVLEIEFEVLVAEMAWALGKAGVTV